MIRPEPSPETVAAIAAAPSLEETMRRARDLEASWALTDWSDAQQADLYEQLSWEDSCSLFGYSNCGDRP